jgi:hypothetical protein
MALQPSDPVVISIEDSLEGTKYEYKVHPAIAVAIKQLLEGPPEGEAQKDTERTMWDSGCRV